MNHQRISWNPENREWFCTTCGRTSDRAKEQEGRAELDEYDCRIPYVESSLSPPGEETVRLIQKPYKMVLKTGGE